MGRPCLGGEQGTRYRQRGKRNQAMDRNRFHCYCSFQIRLDYYLPIKPNPFTDELTWINKNSGLFNSLS